MNIDGRKERCSNGRLIILIRYFKPELTRKQHLLSYDRQNASARTRAIHPISHLKNMIGFSTLNVYLLVCFSLELQLLFILLICGYVNECTKFIC